MLSKHSVLEQMKKFEEAERVRREAEEAAENARREAEEKEGMHSTPFIFHLKYTRSYNSLGFFYMLFSRFIY